MALPSLHARILNNRGDTADEIISGQAARLQAMPELCQLLNALPHPLLILNNERRIVFANRALLDLLGPGEVSCVNGLRVGEVLNCQHAWVDGHVCGQTEACRMCGTARAISLCEHGLESVQECRILRHDGRALDLRIATTPLHLSGEVYTVVALTDIGHEKRRLALERVFFHDLLNITASIMGYAELLARLPVEELPEMGQLIARMVRELGEEIRTHRDLALAEAEDLQVHWEPVSSRRILIDVVESSRILEVASGREIILHPDSIDVTFPCDRLLLTRVLGNMLKNALEASPADEPVRIGCRADDEYVEFWVQNRGVIPDEVRLQIFQRSFSTKGAGRGLGTYSIKLLTERYLHGHASFTSTPEEGTIFTVRYPRSQVEAPIEAETSS